MSLLLPFRPINKNLTLSFQFFQLFFKYIFLFGSFFIVFSIKFILFSNLLINSSNLKTFKPFVIFNFIFHHSFIQIRFKQFLNKVFAIIRNSIPSFTIEFKLVFCDHFECLFFSHFVPRTLMTTEKSVETESYAPVINTFIVSCISSSNFRSYELSKLTRT